MEVDFLLKQSEDRLRQKREARAKTRKQHELEKKRLKEQVDKKVTEAAARRRQAHIAALEDREVGTKANTVGNTIGEIDQKPGITQAFDYQSEYESVVERNDRLINEKHLVGYQLYDVYDKLNHLFNENKVEKKAIDALMRETTKRRRELEDAVSTKQLILYEEMQARTKRNEAKTLDGEASTPEAPIKSKSEAVTYEHGELYNLIRAEKRNARTLQRKIVNHSEAIRSETVGLQQRESTLQTLISTHTGMVQQSEKLQQEIESLTSSLSRAST
eukprot:CFRG8571T1